MKVCSTCGQTKDLGEFYVRLKHKDGHQGVCKECHKRLNARARATAKERKVNQQRFDQVYRGLSIQAKKVYDAIPIKATWSLSQVMQELHRLNLSMSDQRVVTGCLNSLVACGLVVEVSKLMFRREVIKAPVEVKEVKEIDQKETEVNKPIAPPVAAKTNGALDMLGQFAARLRALANEAEIIAMDIAGQAEKNEVETAKMRQLQALLKSLG